MAMRARIFDDQVCDLLKKNPINDVGVTTVWGIDNVEDVLREISLKCKKENCMTPKHLVDELSGFEKRFFEFMFTGSLYKKYIDFMNQKIKLI